VLIMTTNHVERLNSALIQPGWVDKQVAFGLADKDIIAQLFAAGIQPGRNTVLFVRKQAIA
jgi:chaperone BCS1